MAPREGFEPYAYSALLVLNGCVRSTVELARGIELKSVFVEISVEHSNYKP